MISREQADLFAHEWIEAWNSHDLVRILGHYSEDFVMSSPRIASVVQEASGVLVGKPAVAVYWAKALALPSRRRAPASSRASRVRLRDELKKASNNY